MASSWYCPGCNRVVISVIHPPANPVSREPKRCYRCSKPASPPV